MKKLNFLLIFLFAANIFVAQTLSDSDKNEIYKTLDDQRLAWNKGDLKEYMKGYWQSDSLRFIGKSGITYGWKNTLERYSKAYPNKEAMGNLIFDVISLEELNDKCALMVGRWILEAKDKNTAGSFTLIWKKIKNRWVVILDHSS